MPFPTPAPFPFPSKLPDVGTTIFTTMSKLAQEHGAINLSQGFPDYPCHPDLLDALTRAAQAGHNQYAPMTGLPLLRQRIADKIRATRGVAVDADQEVTITAGATQALFTAIATVLRAGDEAILLDPSYDSYAPAILTQGATPVRVSLKAPDFAIDWDSVSRSVTPKTKLIVVNNPNNPATSVFSATDLDHLADILESRGLLLISDEVYEHLVFDDQRHLSVLEHPRLRPRSFVMYSFGKTFHATGWKVGYCVAPPALSSEFRKIHQYLVFSVNTPAQHALAEALADPKHWEDLPAFFQTRRDLLARGLADAGFVLTPSQSTYFQLADYSAIRPDLSEVEFAHWLTVNAGVASIPVSPFYSDARDQHLVRFCFAKEIHTLEAAISRLQELLPG